LFKKKVILTLFPIPMIDTNKAWFWQNKDFIVAATMEIGESGTFDLLSERIAR
jgi:hypothetical protein